MHLILASASPRRAEILRNAGFKIEIRPVSIDESLCPGEPATDYVRRLAEEKARAVARQLKSETMPEPTFIIGADTAVVGEGEILGKPTSKEDARRMLRILSGKKHEVFTGLAVLPLSNRQIFVSAEATCVTFARLSDDEIEDYVSTGEPFDKAGGYGIQGRGGKFISRIEGCYFNVMGMPLARLYAMLRELSADSREKLVPRTEKGGK
ncbi:MAG TPA: Maf family protein [Candidatus Acidoferrales bacterium]|nr:Maf family protein [Candidatus Acidoferrales bacterium]